MLQRLVAAKDVPPFPCDVRWPWIAREVHVEGRAQGRERALFHWSESPASSSGASYTIQVFPEEQMESLSCRIFYTARGAFIIPFPPAV
jgi:hypothetical protein